MKARPSLLLAGCLFALPAFLSAQAQPVREDKAASRDATAQLRAAVEKLRAADLTPAERERLMQTLKKLQDKLEAVHPDGEAPEPAKAFERARTAYEHAIEQAKKAQADDEAARVYLRAHAQEKAAAAEKTMTEHKAELDHADTLVKRLHALHQAEGEAAQGQDKAAAERVRELVRARDGERSAAAQQPGAMAQRLGPAAQDPEIRELIAQVRRQLAEVRRLMDEIRRRMDAPEGARGRKPGRATTPAPGGAPYSVNRNQPVPPAAQPPGNAPDAPPPPATPRARRRGADAETQPLPPEAPTPPATMPRRRTADTAPGMPGGGASPPAELPALPQAPGYGTAPTPAPQPAEPPHGFPLPGVGGVSAPAPTR